MSLFTIDEAKCKKDGICAAECPIGEIIKFDDEEKVPEPVKEMEYLCINCGHCVAVCPHSAFIHSNLSPEDCLPINKEMVLNKKQTEHFLRSRRSIRAYKDKEVEKEKLEELIRLASHAQSGHNMQPVQWQVVYGKEKVKEMGALVVEWMEVMVKENPEYAKMLSLEDIAGLWKAGTDIICRNAPALILVNGPAGEFFSDTACKIAMSYLELAIPSFGLGSQWNGFFQNAATDYKPLQAALGFPDNFANYGTILLGYPKYKYYRMPPRNEPRITWTE